MGRPPAPCLVRTGLPYQRGPKSVRENTWETELSVKTVQNGSPSGSCLVRTGLPYPRGPKSVRENTWETELSVKTL